MTTNGAIRQYRGNLMTSYKNLNDAMTRVQTQRNFNSYADDISNASRAWRTRRAMWRTSDQIDNSSYAINKFSVGWENLADIIDGSTNQRGLDSIIEELEGLNDADAGGRKALGQSCLAKADSVLKSMNCTYGDDFVFAGNDGLNVPFSWGENGEVLYRGIDVTNHLLVANDKGLMEKMPLLTQDDFTMTDEATNTEVPDVDGYIDYLKTIANDESIVPEDYTSDVPDVDNPGSTITVPDQQKYINALKAKCQDRSDEADKLMRYVEEASYTDIGVGMREDGNGEIISTSAYNTSLCGLKYLGFGVDQDGDSRNLIVLMKEAGDILYACDSTSGSFDEEVGDYDRLNELANKLHDIRSNVTEQHVSLDAQTGYLIDNSNQLNDKSVMLNTQLEELEKVNPALAITEMIYANYSYQASLKIGNNILSQSLLDYMN